MDAVEQPISDEQAEALYDAIFVGLGDGTKPLVEGCDHTLTHTSRWAETNGVDFERLKSWLHANGGFCDCEVLFNVMPDDEE